MKSKVLGCLGIFLVLALLCSVVLNVFFFASKAGSGLDSFSRLSSRAIKPQEYQLVQISEPAVDTVTDRIVQIDISGIIMGAETGFGSMVTDMKRALEQATDDPSVKAIVLRIDSPGGEVTASDSIYNAVKAAGKKGKPIVVYMDSMAASGGYYIACGTDTIVCHPTGITGSIGVIMSGYGISDLMTKVGVESRTFKSGAMKDAGAMGRTMTEEEKKYFQDLVMLNYERFVSIVSAARNIPIDVLKNGIADGRIFLGTEAKEKKLVDEVGYIEDAYKLAMTKAGITDAEIVRYARTPRIFDMLGLMGEAKTPGQSAEASSSGRIELDVSDRLLPRLRPGLCYYLAPGMH